MDKQRIRDLRYLRMARIWSGNSYAVRRKVGCLIVSKDDMIISDGYNGTPSGFENVCEGVVDERMQETLEPLNEDIQRKELEIFLNTGQQEVVTKPYVLHAEANAITKLARTTQSSNGATLYCTDMPCMECSKLIIQSGIKRVVYERPYRIDDGVNLLKRAGIEVIHIPCKDIDETDKSE